MTALFKRIKTDPEKNSHISTIQHDFEELWKKHGIELVDQPEKYHALEHLQIASMFLIRAFCKSIEVDSAGNPVKRKPPKKYAKNKQHKKKTADKTTSAKPQTQKVTMRKSTEKKAPVIVHKRSIKKLAEKNDHS